MRREGLPRRRRLARTRDLTAVLRSGARCRTPRLDILWRDNSVGHPRLGVIVPRHGHSAVRRNRLRRQLRELARRRVLPQLTSLDVVLRTRPPAYRASTEQLGRDIDQWLRSHSN